MSEGTKLIAQNKKARFNYSIEDTYECGIELQGTEVKSFKNGNISFPDSFAEIIKKENQTSKKRKKHKNCTRNCTRNCT